MIGQATHPGSAWRRRTELALPPFYLIADPRELTAEEHPYITRLVGRLASRGVDLRSLSLR